ncbi:MAG: type II secretion system minor pseudopilin GspJ [gamma proteobacterium symbiont of Bathyaustriella thionipta]|nr:type II secretion system minor pseudopilin GspJ [gamma proteobacterium symbiont of Bathyaustriella thionipta]MCU7951723.1 type II secretion system minor pseudopilin GspJ [gamma proteobacterium symbiont of Bathyaustriella thionipta]MCU7952338.1 type II secretion system minor pseudopilin GspJ [gamma proteobacterium symbiont of Bathyaustriella thionipta]MCU7958320.1 type II secretion system minor pseudopilin GspJ [gamma proteobacterium symbiont of Bathyaustriella thionipta]MCU7965775.1 type II 
MKRRNFYITFKQAAGFTLLELMVAISIFAVVSLLTMGGLSNILETQAHAEKSLQRLSRFQMVFAVMSRELRQLSMRPVRGEYGSLMDSISIETSDGVDGIEYTHQGRFTLGNTLSVQRVTYYIEDDQLVKKVWPVLDRVEDTQPVKQILLEGIKDLSIEFYSVPAEESGVYNADGWNSSPDDSSLTGLKVTISSTDYGDIYRIYHVAQ